MIAYILAIIFLLKLSSKTHLNAPSLRSIWFFSVARHSELTSWQLCNVISYLNKPNFNQNLLFKMLIKNTLIIRFGVKMTLSLNHRQRDKLAQY